MPCNRSPDPLQQRLDWCSLHSAQQSDIILPALQMISGQRSGSTVQRAPRLATVLILVLTALFACAARADDGTAGGAAEGESASARQEILRNLQDVQRKYGSDAVLFEGHLLGHAIRGGSVTEAAISIPGFEERDGKRFLAFKLDTGIVYNDREVNAAARPARVWSDIVETTLRKFNTLTVPADGIALLLAWSHKDYRDEADLRAHLGEDHGQTEAASFYLLLSDVTGLIARRITSQEIIDRSTVLVNGSPTRVIIQDVPPSNH
jgi:hypothetical protein